MIVSLPYSDQPILQAWKTWWGPYEPNMWEAETYSSNSKYEEDTDNDVDGEDDQADAHWG